MNTSGRASLHITLAKAGDARLVVECACGRTSLLFCRAMARDLGGHHVVAVLATRLRCRAPSCRSAPASVTLLPPPATRLDARAKLRQYGEARTAPHSINVHATTGHDLAAWIAAQRGDDRPRLGFRGGLWSLELEPDEAQRLAYWLGAWWPSR